jgi:hypothetical protein
MFLALRHRETEGSPRSRVFAGLLVALTCAALASTTAAPSAAGQQDDAHLLRHNAHSTTGCPLERIADQFVRCDNLTGAGVPAPSYVPEQP